MRPLFYPVSSMPPFQDFIFNKNINNVNRNAYLLTKNGICLPNGNNLSSEDVKYVCDVFKKIIGIQ